MGVAGVVCVAGVVGGAGLIGLHGNNWQHHCQLWPGSDHMTQAGSGHVTWTKLAVVT